MWSLPTKLTLDDQVNVPAYVVHWGTLYVAAGGHNPATHFNLQSDSYVRVLIP